MSPAQKRLRELRERQSRERQRMAELAMLDTLGTETRAELDGLESGTPDLERQLRAAQVAVEAEERDSTIAVAVGDTPEANRERLELRSRCSLGRYLLGASGRQSGAEAELQQELGLSPQQIPLEIWQRPPEARHAEPETRAITPAPSTVGVNLDVLRPAVFAPSVTDKLMVEMPAVESGTYASGTITTAATADAVPKGGSGTTGEVPETAGAFTVSTTTPHRVGGSLNLAAEDIAAVGQANFEAVLRQHLSLVLSDELDAQMLTGDDQNDDLSGFMDQLTYPTTAISDVATFDDFVAAFADAIDGLWATTMSDVSIVAGVDTYKLSAKTFRDIASADLGSISFADYAREHTAGWWTNKRMPAAASMVQNGIICRKGRSMMPDPMRLAVCPHWGYLSVDDIYTGARKGQRRYVLSVLVGDVILVQPDAYAPVRFKVST